MKRKLCILTSVLWIFVVTLSGCYYTADAEFTFPEEKKETTEVTPKPQGQMEYSYLRGGVVQTAEVADRYFAEYLPTLYTVGDTYDCFFTDPENPNSFTIDISYRLVDWGMCDTMPEVFHDLSEEEKQELVLDEGERYAYCTIEVTGGERHVNETIDVSHVKWVGVTEKDDRLCRISAEKYKTHFMPREFAHTVHDGNRIAMAKGVTKRLHYINIIPEEWIGQEIYFEIDPLGLNMFENHGPGELSEEWRNKEAIYKLSGEYIPTEKPQATPVAPRSTDQFRIDWPFENCQVIQPGETASYKGNKYTDLSCVLDGIYLVQEAPFQVQAVTIAGVARYPGNLMEDSVVQSGYTGLLAEVSTTAGEGNFNAASPVQMEEMYLLAKQGEDCFVFSIYSCDPLNRREDNPAENFVADPFCDRTIQVGETMQRKLLYVIPTAYLSSEYEHYLVFDFSTSRMVYAGDASLRHKFINEHTDMFDLVQLQIGQENEYD